MTSTTSSALVEHRIGIRGRFALRLPAGDVLVRGVDGEVARVRDLDGRSLADQFRIEAADGSLSLRAPEGGFNFVLDLGFLKRGYHANLEVELPRLASVHLETASADVRVDGVQGDGQYKTASGELVLTHAGGSVDVEGVSGEIEIAAEGDLEFGGRTVSGDVSVRAGTFKRLQVNTTSGDMKARGRLVGEGPFSINTVSGDAELVTSSGLRVEAKTLTGDIDAPDERRAHSGPGTRLFSVGDGRVPLSFRSISGDLRISAAGASGAGTTVEPVPAMTVEPETTVEDPAADARLDVLRALERGELTVDEATARLAELDGGADR